MRTYPSTTAYVFNVWSLIKHRIHLHGMVLNHMDKFTFAFIIFGKFNFRFIRNDGIIAVGRSILSRSRECSTSGRLEYQNLIEY
jgi:hypothetical protein